MHRPRLLRRIAAALVVGAATTIALTGAREYPTHRGPWGHGAPLLCGAALTDAELTTLGVPAVARETRAAWVSPVDGGEWPSRPDMSPAEQRAELIAVLDRAAAVGLNAVVLHVRMAADALYPTTRAPWSSYLTRATGGDATPGYDPLAFAVAEAHARGLQLHAWFNPFRAAPPSGGGRELRPGARFVARANPSWVVRYGSQTWIDPGYPAARRAIVDAIAEVVDRYDIDAVHLDDYFYPYLEERTIRTRVGRGKRRRTVVRRETIQFPDEASFRRYGQGFESRGAWRRENVNDLVSTLYRDVKARKPWVLVGVSPFGIWRPGYPSGVNGLDAYSEIFADSRKWWREGWVDYMAPQLYWQLGGEQQRFVKLDAWWRAENVHGRHLWPGLFTMRVASRANPWPAEEIPAQIDQLRQARAGTTESLGHVHFRLGAMSPQETLGARLATATYAEPALPPASPWLGAAAPDAPTVDACAQETLPIAAPPETDLRIRVTKDATDAPRAPAPPPDGAMAPSARVGSGGATVAVTPVGATPVRWWTLQLRDAEGTWHARTLPGDLRALPVALPNGTRASVAVVSAVSPSGVIGARAGVRLD